MRLLRKLTDSELIDISQRLTDTHKKHRDSDPAIREGEFLKVLYPDILRAMQPYDTFAGCFEMLRGEDVPVDFHPQKYAQIGY